MGITVHEFTRTVFAAALLYSQQGRSTVQHLPLQYLTLILTSDDKYTCYQLAQSVLKIGFALAKKLGWRDVGRHNHDMPCTIMVTVLAGCRKALVGTGRALSLLFSMNASIQMQFGI